MLLGAHVSVQGGLVNGPPHGVALGCDVIQLFTRNQRQWTHKPVDDDEAAAFRQAMKNSGLKGAMAHGSYLVNLASPKADVFEKSKKAFLEEAQRCHTLGIDRFVFHPGAHLDSSIADGRAKIAKALRTALDATQGSRVRFLLETMAGQGTTIGNQPEDLGLIIEAAGGDARLGVCIDTCHAYAAGFDIRTPSSYAAVMERFDDGFGLKRVGAFHLNDSKLALGEKRDRHEIIGDGQIGLDGFGPLMRDRRFADVPMNLETPGEDEGYRLGLQRLRSLVKRK